MNINKKWVIAGAVVAVVVVAAAGYFGWRAYTKNQLTPTQKVELELQNLIEEHLPKWDQYEKTTDAKDKKFGNDSTCAASMKGSEDFLSYQKQAEVGEVRKLALASGAYVAYTPNYNNWDAEKLSSFGVKDMRVCSGGWLTPLYAYPDKVVWGNITCSGVEESQAESCLKITRIVMGYFLKQPR